ncbi:MAG TPA: AAA family ATPase [Xanthobacteraceae bacterium]|nr:AAA family ATPase [Xanthobacteraceae bacterium]
MSEVERVLGRVGLTRYANLLQERNIDLDGLMNLTERDLEGLGFPAGARRTLLQEIRRLVAEHDAPLPLIHPVGAERRQLTLMFCDLVDSVGLANRLDPEDLRDVIAAYQRACTQSIRRYDGHVARYVGDGILAFFGYPTAHEDDAERGVRAGRDLIEAVSRLNADLAQLEGFELKARIGIATGLVVVGDVAAGGVVERDAVAGEAANLASRLQGLARPNSIVVSALTRHIAAEAFEYRDLGRQTLKGFDAPVSAYEIVGEREVSRLEARSGAPTPFIDRERETAIMLGCWQRAAAGEGQVLVVSGEAGVGKSRVIAEVCARIRRLESTTDTPLIFQCAPYHANSALYPVVRQLTRLAGIERSDADPDKFDKIDGLIRRSLREPGQAPALIAELLGIKANERYRPVPGGSQEKRDLLIDALIDWCASRVSDHTLIIIVEDAQWIDPTSRLFLRRLADWAKDVRVLIIITVRSGADANLGAIFGEARAPESGGNIAPRMSFCQIAELSQSHVRQLITVAARDRALSAAEMHDLLEKSAGLPLYVEELTKSLLQAREISDAHGQTRTRAFAVPHTISDALMARLDQLGRAKEIAQHAAVIGQEFSLGLLTRITTNSADELVSHLNSLVDTGIVAPSDAATDAYQFRHALIRDIAYHSLLNRTRRAIHLKIANELAQSPPEVAGASDDVIAQHFSLGGEHRQAIDHWRRGATDAIARSAHEEALGMLDSAFDDFSKAQGDDLPAVELDLVLAHGMALRSIRGYSAPEVKERLLRARELGETTKSDDKQFNVQWGLFQHSIVRAEIDVARAIAANLFDLAERHADRPIVDAYIANGMVAHALGNFEQARTLFEKGLELSNPETDPPHFLTHGQNPGLFCLSYLAYNLCFLGYFDLAKSTIERSVAIAEARARDPAHIYGYVNALTFAVRVHQFCGDIASQRQLIEKVVDISRRNHYTYYESLSSCHLGWVIGAEGHLSEGIDQMIAGIAALEIAGTILGLPAFYTFLAELCIRANRLSEAEAALARAIETNGLARWGAEIERLRGDMLLAQPQPNLQAAETAYRSSMTMASRQNAHSVMLKAGLSLSRLVQDAGRPQEARGILEGCLAGLPDGVDAQAVQGVRAALGTLAT